METDYYSPEDNHDAAVGTSEDAAPEAKTALLPKSFFPDKELEVGKECKVRVEQVYEDEVEVAYVKHDTEPKPEMDESMDRMDSLVEPEPLEE